MAALQTLWRLGAVPVPAARVCVQRRDRGRCVQAAVCLGHRHTCQWTGFVAGRIGFGVCSGAPSGQAQRGAPVTCAPGPVGAQVTATGVFQRERLLGWFLAQPPTDLERSTVTRGAVCACPPPLARRFHSMTRATIRSRATATALPCQTGRLAIWCIGRALFRAAPLPSRRRGGGSTWSCAPGAAADAGAGRRWHAHHALHRRAQALTAVGTTLSGRFVVASR